MALSNTDYAASQLNAFGLTPAEDQQLAGLLMWVPGGLVHTGDINMRKMLACQAVAPQRERRLVRTERLELSHQRYWNLNPARLPFRHVRLRPADFGVTSPRGSYSFGPD